MGPLEFTEFIPDEEILLRRVAPSRPELVTFIKRGDSKEYRATSISMSTIGNEKFLSCTLLKITKPVELLEQLSIDDINSDGWKVCMFRASDVRKSGFDVFYNPTPRDEGHCCISGEKGKSIPNTKLQRLAKKTRILTDEEIKNPELIA